MKQLELFIPPRSSRASFRFFFTWCVPAYDYAEIVESLYYEGYAGA